MVFVDELSVVIGYPNREQICIKVLGRMHPGCVDFWDGNWLVSPTKVSIGGFTGEVAAGLRTDELRDFRVELEGLYRDLEGVARFKTLEGWLEIEVVARHGGHLAVAGNVMDRPGSAIAFTSRLKASTRRSCPASSSRFSGSRRHTQ